MPKVKPMTQSGADDLQEAGADVSYLVEQGYSPTDAIAKVASAAKYNKYQTDLLIHSYAAGMAADKRASAGGVFERLAEYELPDPDTVHKMVFGGGNKEPKEAEIDFPSFQDSITRKSAAAPIRFDMRLTEKDLSRLDKKEIRGLFFGEKNASDDEEGEPKKPARNGMRISHVSVIIGGKPDKEKGESFADLFGTGRSHKDDEDNCEYITEIPEDIRSHIKSLTKRLSPELSTEIDSMLDRMLCESKEAMITARANADTEYALLCGMTDNLWHNINVNTGTFSHKAAGLAAVNEYFPAVAALLEPKINKVFAHKIKEASYGIFDVSRSHPYAAEAERIERQIEKVADLTIAANDKTVWHNGVRDFRDDYQKQKKTGASPFCAIPGANTLSWFKEQLPSKEQLFAAEAGIGEKERQRRESEQEQRSYWGQKKKDYLDDIADPAVRSEMDNMKILEAVNDFYVNDDILSAYSMPELLNAYNELYQTFPRLMSDKSTSRSLLQQRLAQGRMAFTELEPAIKLQNKIDDAGSTLKK